MSHALSLSLLLSTFSCSCSYPLSNVYGAVDMADDDDDGRAGGYVGIVGGATVCVCVRMYAYQA